MPVFLYPFALRELHTMKRMITFLSCSALLLTFSTLAPQAHAGTDCGKRGRVSSQTVRQLNAFYPRVQRMAKRSYAFASASVRAPGRRNPNVRVNWRRLPRSISLGVAKALQRASRQAMNRRSAGRYGWVKIRRFGAVTGKVVRISGRRWFIFNRHQYSGNRLYAYQPRSRALYRAMGSYARGYRAAARFTVQRLAGVTGLYRRISRKIRRVRGRRVTLLVPGPRVPRRAPIRWSRLPRTMNRRIVQIMQRTSLRNMRTRPSKKSSYWISVGSGTFAQMYGTRSGQLVLFSTHRYSGNRVVAYNTRTRRIYVGYGSYYRGRSSAKFTVVGPIR